MGHEQELPRQFNTWSMLALAFTVLGTWSTLAQNLASGLTAGGPVNILWGLILVTFCNLCVAVSLGELTSSMPTALGQAYWIFRLQNTPLGRFVSYMCAWINTFGWWTLTASQTAFMTDFILSMKVMFDENWPGAGYGWLEFVIFVGITILLTVINIVACRKDRVLPWINNVVGLQFSLLFVAFAMALLISVGVKAHLAYQSSQFVFGAWINETGWPSGVVWFTGLVQSAYGLTAFDACIHMVEELPAPSKNGPRVIWLSVVIGAISGFIFMMICLFCIQDLSAVKNADLPFIQLCLETMGLTGAAVLLALFIINGVGQNISVMTTASRLTWGFARDGGLPFHRYLAHVNKYWRLPVRALWAQGLLIALIGVLYLFANTVLQAILSVSTIALTVSYAMPIIVLLMVGRDKLPPGPFTWALGLCDQRHQSDLLLHHDGFLFLPKLPQPSARRHELGHRRLRRHAHYCRRVLVCPRSTIIFADRGLDASRGDEPRPGGRCCGCHSHLPFEREDVIGPFWNCTASSEGCITGKQKSVD